MKTESKLELGLEHFKPDIDKVFYDGKNLNLTQLTKELRGKVPNKIIKLYYDNQQIVQVFKPVIKQKQYYKILSYAPFSRIYCDTMYLSLNKSVLAIYNIVDSFSKYAYSKIYVMKKGVSALSSSKSMLAFNEFLELSIVKKFEIGTVYTDLGSENKSNFRENLVKKHILQVYSEVGDHTKISFVERFNKTLRGLIEKYRVSNGKITTETLYKIIDGYNNVPHSNLIYSPNEILNNVDIQHQIATYNNYLRSSYNDKLQIKPLTGYVRIVLKKENTFKKHGATFSDKIYKIVSNDYNTYKLFGLTGSFKRDDLLPVNKDLLMGEKHNIKKEHISEIDSDDEGEQVKYEPRKTRNITIDFKKLNKG